MRTCSLRVLFGPQPLVVRLLRGRRFQAHPETYPERGGALRTASELEGEQQPDVAIRYRVGQAGNSGRRLIKDQRALSQELRVRLGSQRGRFQLAEPGAPEL